MWTLVVLFVTAVMLSHASMLFAASFDSNWSGRLRNDAFAIDNIRGPNPIYRFAPVNPSIGSPSGSLESDGGSARGNYHLTVPIIHLPGRGIDLDVSAQYNSQIWSKVTAADEPMFAADVDGDWPVPGLNLGFGKLIFPDAPLFIKPEGSRLALSEPQLIRTSDRIESKFTDGSGGTVSCVRSYMRCANESGSHSAFVTLENGKHMEMIAAPRSSNYYPARIFDANGNYIKIDYRTDRSGNPTPPNIDHITDTIGRTVQFHYDNTGLPIAISGPDQNSGTRVYARFYYHSFSARIQVPLVGRRTRSTTLNPAFPVLDAIYFPGNQSGYVFSNYTAYGVPKSVGVYRNMTVSTDALDVQGSFTVGAMTRRSTFDFPDNAQDLRFRGSLPLYRERTDSWADPVSGFESQAVTRYTNMNEGLFRITAADGMTTLQHSITDPTKIDYGLVDWIQSAASDGRLLTTTHFKWERGADNIPRQQEVRVEQHEFNAAMRTVFRYGRNNREITDTFTYDYASPNSVSLAPPVRHVRNLYLDNPSYVGRNFSLLSETSLMEVVVNPALPAWQQQLAQLQLALDKAKTNATAFQTAIDRAQAAVLVEADREPERKVTRPSGREVTNPAWKSWNERMRALQATLADKNTDGAPALLEVTNAQNALDTLQQHRPDATIDNELERTNFVYDAGNLMSAAANPSHYAAIADLSVPRGLVSRVTRWLAADSMSITEAGSNIRGIDTVFIHDETGNLRIIRDSPTSQIHYIYDGATDFSLPGSVETGTVDEASPERNKVFTTYNGVGLPSRTTDENGAYYDISYVPGASDWRRSIVRLPAGASLEYAYLDSDLTINQALRDAEGRVYGQAFRYDGRGLLRSTVTTPRADGAQDVAEFEFDNVGRKIRASIPRRIPDTPQSEWINYSYDTAGRLATVSEPNGNVSRWFYNEALVPPGAPIGNPGATVRTVEPQGRERWMQYDSSGQLRVVASPDPATGRVSDPATQIAAYVYDAAGHLTTAFYGSQLRSIRYDSLGRMTANIVPERATTLDIHGNYSRSDGTYSDVYEYDDRSNLTGHVDPRGARTMFAYADDPLNRLQSISYDVSQVGDTSSTVSPVPRTDFAYMKSGDRRRLKEVATQGIVRELLSYDARGLFAAISRTFDVAPDSPLELSMQTDSVGRIKVLTYPAQHIFGRAQDRAVVEHVYSRDGELAQVKLDGQLLVDNARYALAGIKHLDLINSSAQLSEDYEYDSHSGRLRQQTLTSNANPQQKLIDLSYAYRNPQAADESGQLIAQSAVSGRTFEKTHTYDAWGRLTVSARQTGTIANNDMDVVRQSYRYDIYGNRLAVNAQHANPAIAADWIDLPESSADGISTPTVSGNRLLNPLFRYDDAGNLIRGPGPSASVQRYSYDAAGRLVLVTKENGPLLESYQYGADGRRVATSSDAARRYWSLSVWNANVEVARYDIDLQNPAPNLERALDMVDMPVYVGNRIVAELRRKRLALTLRLVHSDYRDVVTTTTTAAGTLQSVNQETMAFGNTLSETTMPADERHFTSYRRSELTGLDYAINRFYDPRLGRFIQPDPLSVGAYDLREPQSFNAYAYARNDPINLVDPLGLTSKSNPIPDCKDADPTTDSQCTMPDGTVETLDPGSTPYVVTAPLSPPAAIPGADNWFSSGGTRSGVGPGAGGTERGRTREEIVQCRNQYLTTNYGNVGGEAIQFLSLGSIYADPRGWAESAFESAVVKGGIFTGSAAILNWQSGKLFLEAATLKTADFAVVGEMQSLRAELQAEAVEGILVSNSIKRAGPYVARALLLAGEFATIQDAGAYISCTF